MKDKLHNLLNKQKELEHDQQVTNDWRAMTTKIDKILFYIFLLLTIISTVGLLVVVPFSRTYTQQKKQIMAWIMSTLIKTNSIVLCFIS
jgi:hypothetical protein